MSDSLNFIYYLQWLVNFLLSLWWIYLPCFLLVLFGDLWIKYKRSQFIQNMKWVLLEIIPPKDIAKTPKAMEQVLTGLHGIQTNPDSYEINFKGKTQPWFSFELVSLGGNLHFNVRCLAMYRDLVEANIYSQYPEAEIREVDDYTQNIPQDVPNQDWELWGTEMVLAKDHAYPILTYPYFGRDITLEEQRLDPLAGLLEVMSKVSEREQIWVQFLARPLKDSWEVGAAKVKHGWKPEAEKTLNKLLGREVPPVSGAFSGLVTEIGAWINTLRGVTVHVVTGEPPAEDAASAAEKKPEQPFLWKSTKQEQNIVGLIEEKISKPGYEVLVRWIYLCHPESFKPGNISAVLGGFKQFSGQHINAFKLNLKTRTSIDYAYQGKRIKEPYRKRRLLNDYRKRDFVQQSKFISYLEKPFLFERFPIAHWFFIRSQGSVLNVEELASLYHFSGQAVKAPTAPRVQAKKGEPPVSLPVG